jgi:hypothetical protein
MILIVTKQIIETLIAKISTLASASKKRTALTTKPNASDDDDDDAGKGCDVRHDNSDGPDNGDARHSIRSQLSASTTC